MPWRQGVHTGRPSGRRPPGLLEAAFHILPAVPTCRGVAPHGRSREPKAQQKSRGGRTPADSEPARRGRLGAGPARFKEALRPDAELAAPGRAGARDARAGWRIWS